jgi:hypothetical protein
VCVCVCVCVCDCVCVCVCVCVCSMVADVFAPQSVSSMLAVEELRLHTALSSAIAAVAFPPALQRLCLVTAHQVVRVFVFLRMCLMACWVHARVKSLRHVTPSPRKILWKWFNIFSSLASVCHRRLLLCAANSSVWRSCRYHCVLSIVYLCCVRSVNHYVGEREKRERERERERERTEFRHDCASGSLLVQVEVSLFASVNLKGKQGKRMRREERQKGGIREEKRGRGEGRMCPYARLYFSYFLVHASSHPTVGALDAWCARPRTAGRLELARYSHNTHRTGLSQPPCVGDGVVPGGVACAGAVCVVCSV